MFFFESISTPRWKSVDYAAMGEGGRCRGALVLVTDAMATPGFFLCQGMLARISRCISTRKHVDGRDVCGRSNLRAKELIRNHPCEAYMKHIPVAR